MSEEKLIEGCKVKDMGSREELYRLFFPKMYAVCRRLVNSDVVVEDLVHDGFIKVFANIGGYDGRGSFEGWLRKIFVNVSLDYLRDNCKAHMMEFDDNQVVDEYMVVDGLLDLDYDELMEIIGNIPDDIRVVLSLFCVEGYKHTDIASMLGISVKTSLLRLEKGKAMVLAYYRECFKGNKGTEVKLDRIGTI